MRICVVSCAFLLVITTSARSQFNETIRTGRPGQAIGTFTVGQGILQVQSGVDHFASDDGDLGIKTIGFLSNTVLRYGLTDLFEVSTVAEYKTATITENSATTRQQGLSALDVGIRYHIYTGKGLIPNIGFQFRTRLPVLSDDYKIKDLAPRFLLATSQHLSKKFTLITNWGASWTGNDSSPTGNYVINLSFPFNDRWGAFIENYGRLHQGVLTTNWDTGIAWLVNNDLQFDFYGGYGDNQRVKAWFLSAGVSIRTKK